jgi:hydrogenase maturation factor/phosphoglycolate phosphatase-like HAD superfamily hydrolase
MTQIHIEGYRIRAVLFDFDGTLTRPGALDFGRIKQTLNCPSDFPILEYIRSIDDVARRQAAMDQLDRFELEGARISQPNPGAQRLVQWLKSKGLAVGVITRNSLGSVLRAFENFDRIGPDDFDVMVTRDTDVAPKPSGDGIVWAARQLGVRCREILEVGDYLFDPQAGLAAGALTVLLDPGGDERLTATACHFRIAHLDELRPIIRAGLALKPGKLPNDLLERYLADAAAQDPSVLIPPRVGEDVTAVRIDGEEVLVLKADPITFAGDAMGRYAVLVNANDIATAGAVPRWFLTTLLFPPGTSASQIRQLMAELGRVCGQWDIALCGGHTEITDAVRRPIVSGMMIGTVKRGRMIEKRGMRRGDIVLLTKHVAVEGLSIIAREFGDLLVSKGISAREIDAAKGMLEQISILPEARIASRRPWATAMHDVTEGGLATALVELSSAGGHRIAVDLSAIPVPDLTRKICAAVGMDPLGLIGSGSLLICCRKADLERLCDALRTEDIAVTPIGRVLGPGSGIEAGEDGRPVPWPAFAVDEITKLYNGSVKTAGD